MARSLWSGSLSFGLVSVPVALHSGVVDTDLHFRQLHAKEYLALVRARSDRLTLTTLRFHDEVRPAKDVPTPTKRDKPAKQEVDQAVALIEALACPWDPDRYEDAYQKRLKKIVREKGKGKTIEMPESEKEPSPVPDLMAALEQTLAEIKG
jgi:DNA end-binding protein Ku